MHEKHQEILQEKRGFFWNNAVCETTLKLIFGRKYRNSLGNLLHPSLKHSGEELKFYHKCSSRFMTWNHIQFVLDVQWLPSENRVHRTMEEWQADGSAGAAVEYVCTFLPWNYFKATLSKHDQNALWVWGCHVCADTVFITSRLCDGNEKSPLEIQSNDMPVNIKDASAWLIDWCRPWRHQVPSRLENAYLSFQKPFGFVFLFLLYFFKLFY